MGSNMSGAILQNMEERKWFIHCGQPARPRGHVHMKADVTGLRNGSKTATESSKADLARDEDRRHVFPHVGSDRLEVAILHPTNNFNHSKQPTCAEWRC